MYTRHAVVFFYQFIQGLMFKSVIRTAKIATTTDEIHTQSGTLDRDACYR